DVEVGSGPARVRSGAAWAGSEAAWARSGGAGGASTPLSAVWPALAAAADWGADNWGVPDAGRWESAGPRVPLVASRVQAWFALDRMARLGLAANPLDLP